MNKYFKLLSVALLFLNFTIHKNYIAYTEIEYKEDKKSVQIIMNIFVDDIELAVNKEYKTDLKLADKNEDPKSDKYLLKYLNNHSTITINDQKKAYKFIGKEYYGNILSFYLEIENITSFKTIEVQNDILIEHFPDQQNLIRVTVNKNRKSLFLDRKNDKGLLKF
ncbi:conserved protein of unknown function [Tenacibaculum sp. 190524A02b]|uniref:DUF6702 family protein n=1 Tax=Tenacibaculum vairaonense TaxID=3137860 RepID=UPI0032B2BA19